MGQICTRHIQQGWGRKPIQVTNRSQYLSKWIGLVAGRNRAKSRTGLEETYRRPPGDGRAFVRVKHRAHASRDV